MTILFSIQEVLIQIDKKRQPWSNNYYHSEHPIVLGDYQGQLGAPDAIVSPEETCYLPSLFGWPPAKKTARPGPAELGNQLISGAKQPVVVG